MRRYDNLAYLSGLEAKVIPTNRKQLQCPALQSPENQSEKAKHFYTLMKRRFVPLKRRKKKLLRRFSKMKRRFIFRVSVLSEKEVAAYFIFLFSLFTIRLFAECQVQAHEYGNTAQIRYIERKSFRRVE